MAQISANKNLICDFYRGETVKKTITITTDELGLTVSDTFVLRIKKAGATTYLLEETYDIYNDSGILKTDITITDETTNDWTANTFYNYQFLLNIDATGETFVAITGKFLLLEKV